MHNGFLANSMQAMKALTTRRVEIQCDLLPFRFDDVPLPKILNWIRLEAGIHCRSARPRGWPTHLQVEPTNLCNLRCSLCPVTEGLHRPSGFMDFHLYRRLIDEVSPWVFLMLFWEWGEPFVHPRAYEMIEYATRRGIKVLASTNGHRFADPGHAEKAVCSGLDTLIFALDGISQDTYERYRQGGKLETVLTGIRTVVAKKREMGSLTPRINLRFIVMKYNEHEIPQLEGLADSLGVDVLTLKTLYPGHDSDPSLDSENPFIPQDRRYRRFCYSDDGATRIRAHSNTCKVLWNHPSVHWNGLVCPCSFDPHENHVLGDLTQGTFRDVWYGEAYRKMRQNFRDNWESVPLCSRCSYAWKGGNCATETVREAVYFTR